MRPSLQSTLVDMRSQHLYLLSHQRLFNVWAMNLGEKIRHYRDGLGWTLDHLSDLSGVEKGTIHALEARNLHLLTFRIYRCRLHTYRKTTRPGLQRRTSRKPAGW